MSRSRVLGRVSIVAGVNTSLAFIAGGFLGAAGKSGWDALQRRLGERVAKRKERRARAAEASRRSEHATTTAEAERTERVQLVERRVGAKFRRRYTAYDQGTELSVLSLGNPDWRCNVIVEETVPAGRPSTEHDSVHPRVNMEWRVLVESDDDQRHRTARLYEQAFDDSVGWIEYQRMK